MNKKETLYPYDLTYIKMHEHMQYDITYTKMHENIHTNMLKKVHSMWQHYEFLKSLYYIF